MASSDATDLKDEIYVNYLSVRKSVLWELSVTNTIFQSLNDFWCWNPLRKCQGRSWCQFFPDVFLDTSTSPSASLLLFFTQIQEVLTILCETWMVTHRLLFLLVTYDISQFCRTTELWKGIWFYETHSFFYSCFLWSVCLIYSGCKLFRAKIFFLIHNILRHTMCSSPS